MWSKRTCSSMEVLLQPLSYHAAQARDEQTHVESSFLHVTHLVRLRGSNFEGRLATRYNPHNTMRQCSGKRCPALIMEEHSVFEPGFEKSETYVICLTKLKKVRHMSHQAEKGETCLTMLRHMFHQAVKGETHHYFEASISKPVCMVAMQVCMVAMHYQLPFMISKCLLQSQ